MAAFDFHKGKDQVVVQQLHELFGDKLHLDIIKTVAKSCKFDVNQSSNELLEIANTGPSPTSPSAYMKTIDRSPVNVQRKSRKAQDIERVVKEINSGFKVLVLLRGLPGSGKSTLAKTILRDTIGLDNGTAKTHILSTDDFFMKRNGDYEYNPLKINEAHGWNHQRAFSIMSKGFSPVIVDNTNTQMWEMKPYAIMATDYGYILEILEPDTHWCFNDKELVKRNSHGVPKASIRSMLERYEKNVTPMKLLTAYGCKYKFQRPPQYRLHPPLVQAPYQQIFASEKNSVNNNSNFLDFHPSPIKKVVQPPQSSSVDDILMYSDSSFLNTPVLKPIHTTKLEQSNSLFDNINAWGVDETALRSWDIVTPLKEDSGLQTPSSPILIEDDADEIIETREMSTNTDAEDFYISRNILTISPPGTVRVLCTLSRDINRNNPIRPQAIRKKIMAEKSCLTEDFLDEHNVVHLENLAGMFPHVPRDTVHYWYEKCNRDFDCTIDLLLAEKDEFINVIIEEELQIEPIVVDSDSGSSTSDTPPTAQSAKHKRKNYSSSSDESQDLKKYIESKVTISDDHYSQKLLKIKQRQYQGPLNITTASVSTSPPPEPEPCNEGNFTSDCDDIEWEEPPPKADNIDHIEMVELNLGDHFVKQLEDNFGDPNLLYPKGFQPVVQMPVALARQLYTFYIESVYQQMEAQNSIMEDLLKEDEEFARKLQEAEENASQVQAKPNVEPTEIPDIIREQRELSRCQKEAERWKKETPDTLAARLTREKLFNTFQTIDKNTLLEILHAHNNVYKDTVETLLASAPGFETVNGDFESIKNPPLNKTVVEEMWEAHDSCNNDEEQQENACSGINYREEANHYLEKRKNLYEKAQRYHQSGMIEVAQFYSGLASKQTRLCEQANSLAATAFLDENSKRLEDFNTLDLHSLYVKEAIPNLDIFLDRNINLLRLSTSKSSECLQIITGRGKNSKNGIAKIRPAVITRLKERKIRYQLLNPGLLKVKVTKTSKVTSEI